MSFNSLRFNVPLYEAQQKKDRANPSLFYREPLGPLTSGFVLACPEREREKERWVVEVTRIQSCVHFKREILKGFLGGGRKEGFRKESQKDGRIISSVPFCTGVLAVCAEG